MMETNTPTTSVARSRTDEQQTANIEAFLRALQQNGVDRMSDAARDSSEQFRNAAGLLPDAILGACYPRFYELQQAVSERIQGRGGRHFVAHGGCDDVWPQPLNMRQGSYLDLRFELGYMAVTRFPLALAAAPIIDMTGTQCSRVDGFRATVKSGTTPPGCGAFMGREEYQDTANVNTLSHCDIRGAFGDGHDYGGACYVLIGSEVFHLIGCNGRFTGKRGGAVCTSAYNKHRIVSPHGPIAGGYIPGHGGAQSNAGGTIDGCCRFACDGNPDGSDPDDRYVIAIGSRTCDLSFVGTTYVTAKTAGGCGCVIRLGDAEDIDAKWGRVWDIDIGLIHDEAYAAKAFVRVDGSTRNVVLHGTEARAGVVLACSDRRNLDGIRLDGVSHNPREDYWASEPAPAEQQTDPPLAEP